MRSLIRFGRLLVGVIVPVVAVLSLAQLKRRRGFAPAADADFHTHPDHSTQPRASKRFEQQVD
jgi:hypothetical protein